MLQFMRETRYQVWGRLAAFVVLLVLSAGPARVAGQDSIPGPPPAITNVAQLGQVDEQDSATNYWIGLEGAVWWANPLHNRLVLSDATGAVELQLDLKGQSIRAGQRVRLEGPATIVRRGAGFRIGTQGAVVDNDGTHRTLEKSGTVYLKRGRHPFRVEWFNGAGKPGLEVSYEGPDLPRQKIPDGVLFRDTGDDAGRPGRQVNGLSYRCYEGDWESLPDFTTLTPVKSGNLSNLNLKGSRTRDRNVAVQFMGWLEVPREGLYTFNLKSAAGSRLFVGEPTIGLAITGEAGFPTPAPIRSSPPGPRPEGGWMAAEGRVTQLREDRNGFEMELAQGGGRVRVELGEPTPDSTSRLTDRWVRATGFYEPAFAAGGQRTAAILLVPSGREIEVIEAPADHPPGTHPLGPAALTTADQVRRLQPRAAQPEYAFRIRGVVTCVQDDQRAFVIQDGISGVTLVDASAPPSGLPQMWEFLEIEGVAQKGQAKAQRVRHLGAGSPPEPLHPAWNQFLNASLDSQWVEIVGLVESSVNRSNGWSRLSLRIGGGVLKLDLLRSGVSPGPPEQYENAVVRLRGCLLADWQPGTLQLKVGQFRMYTAEVSVDQPAPNDLFSLPTRTAASLKHFDPSMDNAHRVKVAGQVVHVRGTDYFLMDGANGLRFLAKEPLALEPGDRVEVVGFPELSGAAPVLRAAVARKVGRAALPEPTPVPAADLNNLVYDSTLVRVEGMLAGLRRTAAGQVLEIQAGASRFLARLNTGEASERPLRLGSRLELTGVYRAQGGYVALGEDVVPLDLLLNSPADIKVLALPPWWTLRKLLVIVGILGCALAILALWITQLHRQVEQRTAELGAQIQERQRVEHQGAMEQERARIARDLHDELGSDITEIGMLAARAKSMAGSEAERVRYLEQAAEKSRQVVAALEEIVWAMNPLHDSVVSIVRYFSFYADRFLGLARIRWQFEGPSSPVQYAIDARLRHQLFLAFKEALANVVRHSGATEVRFSLQVQQGELWLAIADNGRGLPEKSPTEGMDGIANMKTRIEKLGGRFEITSQNGCGTTVRFCLPSRAIG
jgi:signal transduction histidine kinase